MRFKLEEISNPSESNMKAAGLWIASGLRQINECFLAIDDTHQGAINNADRERRR
jgi:hypothetical protein